MVRSELVSAPPPPGSQFPAKQIFPPEPSQKPEELKLVPHCAFIDVVTWGNKVKAVSLPRTSVETLRGSGGVGERSVPMTLCLKWIFVFSCQY